MTKKYCDICQKEILSQHPFMQYVYPQKALTMDHLKTGGQQPWVAVNKEACEDCMKIMLDAIGDKQNA